VGSGSCTGTSLTAASLPRGSELPSGPSVIRRAIERGKLEFQVWVTLSGRVRDGSGGRLTDYERRAWRARRSVHWALCPPGTSHPTFLLHEPDEWVSLPRGQPLGEPRWGATLPKPHKRLGLPEWPYELTTQPPAPRAESRQLGSARGVAPRRVVQEGPPTCKQRVILAPKPTSAKSVGWLAPDTWTGRA
jgi:hypothetical protein